MLNYFLIFKVSALKINIKLTIGCLNKFLDKKVKCVNIVMNLQEKFDVYKKNLLDIF